MPILALAIGPKLFLAVLLFAIVAAIAVSFIKQIDAQTRMFIQAMLAIMVIVVAAVWLFGQM